MGFRLAVFDMAGTTVFDGDAVHRCLGGALRVVAGREFSRDQINRVMGIPKPVAIARLLNEAPTATPDDAQIASVLWDFERRMLEHYRHGEDVREVDGATAVFERLRRQGVCVGLDTGFSRSITDAILERLGWAVPTSVDATVTSDEVAAGRPAPDMIFRAMELTAVRDASDVIKIGDTPADLLQGAAARCGMVVGVTSGSHTEDQLREYPHTVLIHHIRELPDLLGRS